MISVCYVTYKEQKATEDSIPLPVIIEIDIILPNSITIYQFLEQAVYQLSYFVTEYDSIWNDKSLQNYWKKIV